MQHFPITHQLRANAFGLLATLALLVTSACSSESPEQALRLQLTSMQEAIEARDAGDIHAILGDDFIGNDGLDRRGARQLAVSSFLRHRDVSARFGPVQVEMRGQGDAIVRFTVLATGGSGGLLPDSGEVFDVQTGWRDVDGEWRLITASWKSRL